MYACRCVSRVCRVARRGRPASPVEIVRRQSHRHHTIIIIIIIVINYYYYHDGYCYHAVVPVADIVSENTSKDIAHSFKV